MTSALFETCATQQRFAEVIVRFLADRTAPVPVWLGGRTDLADGIALAADVYDRRRTPQPCDTGVVMGEPPAEIGDLARPLASNWVRTVDALPGRGTVLVLGVYRDLDGDRLRTLVDLAHREQRGLYVLTGRDVHSLSWMIAKQYVSGTAGDVGVFSEVDPLPPVGDATWFGAAEIAHQDVKGAVLDRVWRRVLFHGHAKDDQLNLGQFTVCGLSPAATRAPGAQGPRCAYGLACPKPEDKLIPAHAVKAAEMVLDGCYSGPLSGHASYDPKYQLLLNAVDGPPQTVLATLTASDSNRPETATWLTHPPSAGGTASVMNRRLADINPVPTFVQVGLEPDAGTRPDLPDPPAVDDATLHLLGTRVSGYLSSGLLDQHHPLRPPLEQFADHLIAYSARTSWPSADRADISAEVVSLDLAIAQRLARGGGSALLDFPTHFGVRSKAGESVDVPPCACGRPLRGYVRRGTLPVIVDTIQGFCPRCGDVLNSMAGSPRLRVEAAGEAVVGGELPVTVTVVSAASGVVDLGITLPGYLNATVRPLLRRVQVRAGELAHAELSVDIAADAAPQTYYCTVFAVHDLGIATLRVHFNLSEPPTG